MPRFRQFIQSCTTSETIYILLQQQYILYGNIYTSSNIYCNNAAISTIRSQENKADKNNGKPLEEKSVKTMFDNLTITNHHAFRKTKQIKTNLVHTE